MEVTDPRKKALGQRLQERREAKKLTQTQVGSHFGVDKGTVSAWEKGRGVPDALRLADLARIYGVATDALVYERPPRPFSEDVWELAANLDALDDSKKGLALRLCWEVVRLANGKPTTAVDTEVPVLTKRQNG